MFREDGRWGHYGGSLLLASGTYRMEGNTHFQLTNSGGCPPTSFAFTFDGRLLKFQLTDESRNEPCLERNDLYNSKTYILSE